VILPLIDGYNERARPFTWGMDADASLATAVIHQQTSGTEHWRSTGEGASTSGLDHAA
jgi:hypothetical protein